MPKIIFFQGYKYQSIHARFYQECLGGQLLECDTVRYQRNYPKRIFDLDSEDTVWFFNDIYHFLHSKLKGKQIHISHGLGFAKPINSIRAYYLKRYFDAIFCTGVTNQHYMIEKGVDVGKMYQIGLTALFYVPKIKAAEKTILFSSTRYAHWNHFDNFIKILQDVPPDWTAYVTTHAHSFPKFLKKVEELCAGKPNLIRIRTNEELLESYAKCQMAVSGGLTSAVAPFHFLKKPVIFLRGHSFPWRYAKYCGLGWGGIKRYIGYELFDRVLDESLLISKPSEMKWDRLLSSAKASRSSEKMFFPSNGDEDLTRAIIQKALADVIKK